MGREATALKTGQWVSSLGKRANQGLQSENPSPGYPRAHIQDKGELICPGRTPKLAARLLHQRRPAAEDIFGRGIGRACKTNAEHIKSGRRGPVVADD